MRNYSTSKLKLSFFGETYTVNGHKPAKEKVQAIAEMPTPSCKKEVQSFTGLINYLSTFSARLTELALPIRQLVKDKVAFNWDPEHQTAFKLVKNEIITTPMLAYYDPRKPLYYKQMPASVDLGPACSKMKNQYTSKQSLTEAQRGYIAIELESLAVA